MTAGFSRGVLNLLIGSPMKMKEGITMKEQLHTSAPTSINATRLPRAYKVAMNMADMRADIRTMLDYGCGRYTDHLTTCASMHALTWAGYDPFNYPTNIDGQTFDMIVCANVLNVIDSDDVILDILHKIASHMRPGGVAVITVYEGDKSGVGRETMQDCYQRNAKMKDYIQYLNRIFGCINIVNGAFICAID